MIGYTTRLTSTNCYCINCCINKSKLMTLYINYLQREKLVLTHFLLALIIIIRFSQLKMLGKRKLKEDNRSDDEVG